MSKTIEREKEQELTETEVTSTTQTHNVTIEPTEQIETKTPAASDEVVVIEEGSERGLKEFFGKVVHVGEQVLGEVIKPVVGIGEQIFTTVVPDLVKIGGEIAAGAAGGAINDSNVPGKHTLADTIGDAIKDTTGVLGDAIKHIGAKDKAKARDIDEDIVEKDGSEFTSLDNIPTSHADIAVVDSPLAGNIPPVDSHE